MKKPTLNYLKLLQLKNAIIINDDSRLNKKFFESIIDKSKNINNYDEIIYFPVDYYVQLGYDVLVIWKNFQRIINLEEYKNKTVLFLMEGLDYLSKKQFNFKLPENIYFYGIASNFVNWKNRNLFLQLIPKFYCEYNMDLSYLTKNYKWNDFNHFIYHYCFVLYEANNLVKMQENWNENIEKLISQKVFYLENKRINSLMLRKIIKQIAISSLGAFQIGLFCDQNDLRYESVILAINFLIEIKLIAEVRYVLKNDLHSKKKQSFYFIRSNFVYFYFCHFTHMNIPVENIVISQIINDFNQFNQYAPTTMNYQIEKVNTPILKFKLGINEFKINLINDNHEKIQLSESLMQKLYNINVESFAFNKISRKSFFSQKKINIISATNNEKNDINLFNYLVKINF